MEGLEQGWSAGRAKSWAKSAPRSRARFCAKRKGTRPYVPFRFAQNLARDLGASVGPVFGPFTGACFRPAFCAGVGWPSIMEPCYGPLWLTLCVLQETSREPMQGSSARSLFDAADSTGAIAAQHCGAECQQLSSREVLLMLGGADRAHCLPRALSAACRPSLTLDVWCVSAESPWVVARYVRT